MNKLFTKIVGAFLGLTMAVGVGVVAANSNKGVEPAQADSGTWTLAGPSSNGTEVGSNYSTGVGGITVTGDKNTNSNAPKWYATGREIRVYANNYLTFSISSGSITAISFTYSSGYSNNWSEADVGTLNSNAWSGNASSVRFTGNASSQIRFTAVTFTYESGSGSQKEIINKTIVGPSNFNMVIGESDVNIADDVKVDSVKLDYDSGNGYTVTSATPSVVSVSGTTLHAEAKGSAKITISKSDVETEETITKYASAEFTVTVTNPPIELPDMPDGDYEKITTSSDLVDGFYLLVNEANNKIFDGSLSSLDQQSGYSVTISDNTIETSATIDAKALYISALEGTNEYSIVANVGETNPVYIGRNANSNGVDTSDGVLVNTITISEGLSSILGAGGRKLTYYNNTTFRYYASSNATTVSLYKKTSTAPVVDVYSQNISLSKDSTTIPLGDSETITATIDQAATVRTITWESSNNKVHVTDGAISVDADAIVDSTATITAKVPASAAENDYLTATCTVTVGPAKLTGLTRNGYNAYYIGQKISDYQGGSVMASWTAGDPTAIALDNANLTITLGGNSVTKDTILEASDNGKQIRFTYQDPNYAGVSKYTSNYSISVGSFFELDDLSASFTDSKNYILKDDTDSTLSFGYTSWGGQATLSVTSSNEDVLEAAVGTHSFSNRKGTGTIVILAYAQGTAVITLSATVNEQVLTKSYTVLVRASDPETSGGDTSYVLISSLSDLTSDDYVIGAYDSSYVGMEQTLTNGKYSSSSLTVSSGTITSSVTGLPYTLTVSGTGNSRTVTVYNPSTSKYVKYNSSTNLAEDSSSYSFTVTIVDNYFRFTSQTSGRGLCYGTSQTKFGGYVPGANGYNDLCLFKKTVSGQVSDDVTIVQTFVNTYMHPEVLDSNRSDTGACRGENGYYAVAKSHLQSDLNDAQRLVFKNTFAVYYQRMIDWGVACTENFAIDNTGALVTSARNSRAIFNIVTENQNTASIIVIISLVGLTTISGYFFLRKRKEQ